MYIQRVQILLNILRLASVVVAVVATTVILFGGAGRPALTNMPILAALLIAYAWGLVIALFHVRPIKRPTRTTGWALLPLGIQLSYYMTFWIMLALGATDHRLYDSVSVATVISFFAGFVAPIIAMIALRRIEPLLIVEVAGPTLTCMYMWTWS